MGPRAAVRGGWRCGRTPGPTPRRRAWLSSPRAGDDGGAHRSGAVGWPALRRDLSEKGDRLAAVEAYAGPLSRRPSSMEDPPRLVELADKTYASAADASSPSSSRAPRTAPSRWAQPGRSWAGSVSERQSPAGEWLSKHPDDAEAAGSARPSKITWFFCSENEKQPVSFARFSGGSAGRPGHRPPPGPRTSRSRQLWTRSRRSFVFSWPITTRPGVSRLYSV